MTKRALSLLLALIMALSLCVPAFAAEGDGEAAEAPEVSEAVEDTAPTDAEVAEEPAEEAEPEAEETEESAAEVDPETEESVVEDEPAVVSIPTDPAVVASLKQKLETAIAAAAEKEAAANNNEVHDAGQEGANNFLNALAQARAWLTALNANDQTQNFTERNVDDLVKKLEKLTKELNPDMLPSQIDYFWDSANRNADVLVRALGLNALTNTENGVVTGYWPDAQTVVGDTWSYPMVNNADGNNGLFALAAGGFGAWKGIYSDAYLARLTSVVQDAKKISDSLRDGYSLKDIGYKAAQDAIDGINAVRRSDNNGNYLEAKKVTGADYAALNEAFLAAQDAYIRYQDSKDSYYSPSTEALINNMWLGIGTWLYTTEVRCPSGRWYANLPLSKTWSAHDHSGNGGYLDASTDSGIHADLDDHMIVQRRIKDLKDFVAALEGMKIGTTAAFGDSVYYSFCAHNPSHSTNNNRKHVQQINVDVSRMPNTVDALDNRNIGEGSTFYVYGYTVTQLDGHKATRVFANGLRLSAAKNTYSSIILEATVSDNQQLVILPISANGSVLNNGCFNGGEEIVINIYQVTRGDFSTTTGEPNYYIDGVVDTMTIKLESDNYTGPILKSATYAAGVANGPDTFTLTSEFAYIDNGGTPYDWATPGDGIQVDAKAGSSFDRKKVIWYVAGSAVINPDLRTTRWNVRTDVTTPVPAGDISVAFVSDECLLNGHRKDNQNLTHAPNYFLRNDVVVNVPPITTWGDPTFRTHYYEFEDVVTSASGMIDKYVTRPGSGLSTAEAQKLLKENYDVAKDFVDNAATYGNCLYYRDLMNKLMASLRAAMGNLIKPVDTTTLEGAIARAEALKKVDYTEESYARLEAALKNAKDVLANTDLSADVAAHEKLVKDTINTLNKAVDELVKKDADVASLATPIEEAKAAAEAVPDLTGYTKETVDAVNAALEALKAEITKAEAVAAKSGKDVYVHEVDDAKAALEAAVKALKDAIDALQADLTELNAAIAAADAKVAECEAIDLAQYSGVTGAAVTKALDALKAELVKAKAMTGDTAPADVAAEVKAVNAAVEALSSAMQALLLTDEPESGKGWTKGKSGKYWYYMVGGKAVKNTWVMSKRGIWYFMDANGIMVTGVQNCPEVSVYYTEATGRQTTSSPWPAGLYFFEIDGPAPGRVRGGWQKDPNYGDVYANPKHDGRYGMVTWTTKTGDVAWK